MKNYLLSILMILFLFPFINAQTTIDSTGFDGDNFSLEGALQLMKESSSLEEFEKKLNEEDNYVNNLDLNQDGKIEYVKVNDNMEEEIHAIALQVDVSASESQDVAVILIERTGDNNAVMQIIGDEDVYGEEVIVEPYAESMDFGGRGNALWDYGAARVVVNVWTWPSVRFIYTPGYVVYRSPWRWLSYPKWWKPWNPHPWRWHYNKRSVYHVHFRPFHTHRVVKAHSFYKPKRKSSVTVKTRTVHTRTVVKKGPGGKKTTLKKTKVTNTTTSKGTLGKKKTSRKSKSTVEKKKGVIKKNKGATLKGKKTTKTKKVKKSR